eukprot:NODE_4430_length_802_cov_14.750332_g3675_i0.p1 GENE.NODE_4430_length_802_cov_14.750332_g3675_i0~~NODE_4430_length_802_cov_14.750332_g3675_i0.p1  ORF type:complete len:214 (+),score=54.63 NODE_4430_length_802_cov_14.750332_g3675_i0:104-745(+)
MAECSFGVVFDNHIVLATSSSSFAHGILKYADEDKIHVIDGEKQALATVGDAADRVQFCEYMVRNICLNRTRSLCRATCSATAHFIRNELAENLRSRRGPYVVNILFGGWDDAVKGEEAEPELYWFDYLGSMQKVRYAAHGLGGTFATAILDRWYQPNMAETESLALIKKCIDEVNKRLIVNSQLFAVKIIDKEGVRSVPWETVCGTSSPDQS